MQLLPLEEVRPGMRLARSVLEDGRLVLAAGVTWRPEYGERLRELGQRAVYVAEPDELSEIEVPDAVARETRQVLRWAMGQTVKRLGMGSRLNPALVQDAVRLLVEDVLGRKEVLVSWLDVRGLSDHTPGHSAQVAVLTVLLGRLLGMSRRQLEELGTGALLHDIGKVGVPEEILQKPAALTGEEMAQVRRHGEYGFEILRRVPGIGLAAAHVAYQHHERWDGKGYPRGLKRKQIHPYARICAVCDVYDAITSTRPYREAAHPQEALRYIQENAGAQFDPAVVKAFLRLVAPYPVGTRVELSGGEAAVVADVRWWALERPVVKVVRDRAGRPVRPPREVDLALRPELRVVDQRLWGEAGPQPQGGAAEDEPAQLAAQEAAAAREPS